MQRRSLVVTFGRGMVLFRPLLETLMSPTDDKYMPAGSIGSTSYPRMKLDNCSCFLTRLKTLRAVYGASWIDSNNMQLHAKLTNLWPISLLEYLAMGGRMGRPSPFWSG